MNLYHAIFLSVATLAASLPAEALDLQISAGELSSLLTDEVKSATTLTLKGTMDKRDFDALSEMTSLTSLDLSAVSIVAYTPTTRQDMMKNTFDADALPPGALLGKGLTKVTLPASLRIIDQAALAGNSFATIELPATLTEIGTNAFYGNEALTSITIPASVKVIGSQAFGDCEALKSATINSSETGAGTFLRCTALESVTLGSTMKKIGESAFAGCTALKSVAFPSGLTAIAAGAFTGTGLEEVSLPASVAETGDYAFAICPTLKTVTFKGMPELGEGMFFSCPELEEVAFTSGEQPAEYPDYLFAGNCSMTGSMNIEGTSHIGRYAMRGTGVDTLRLGYYVESLGDHALEGMTRLKDINVSSLGINVPALGEDVFAGINQSDVTLSIAEDCEQPWLDAPQWQDFKIQTVSSVTAPDAEKATVRAFIQGALLKVTSTDPINTLQVTDPSGALLVSINPADCQAEVDLNRFSSPIFIVVAKTAHTTATFKLTH
ncbi:MAG: leucine-rich repeat domain-containing protein [Bacteroidales bacterium]|nr:leucine-rich repeat domain-containing protein [Bacteroidales bacterium]